MVLPSQEQSLDTIWVTNQANRGINVADLLYAWISMSTHLKRVKKVLTELSGLQMKEIVVYFID